jgi:hypothetical protein
VTINDEVAQLIHNVPSAESYPDAGIINLLDEDIVEVFEDGRCRQTLHVVIKILNEKGKDKGDMGNLIKDFPYPFQFNHCKANRCHNGLWGESHLLFQHSKTHQCYEKVDENDETIAGGHVNGEHLGGLRM